MKTRFAYPRLADGPTLARLADVRERAERNPTELEDLVAFEHPAAAPVPTGALIADAAAIENLRNEVLAALDGWFTGEPIPRGALGDFDRALGSALHASARLLPADAAHQGTWNFLSAMVFPDVVWARFPDLSEERFLGRPRNALRRVWWRQEMLGELLGVAGPSGLGEDELVGLLERTSLARNRRLVHAAASRVLKYSGSLPRSEWAREFYKRLTYQTGPLLLDVLRDEELIDLVDAVAEGRPWVPAEAEAISRASFGPLGEGTRGAVNELDSRLVAPTSLPRLAQEADTVLPSSKNSGDLVKEFHREMLNLISSVREEVDYKPTLLLRAVIQDGGLAAARRIAGSTDLSDGFVVLWRKHRLDLTVEHLVLNPRFSGLFGDELLETARAKLVNAGWRGD